MALLHIMIAHFLGDFVLQPKIILEKKYKSWVGTLLHSLIIASMVAFFLMPYWQHFQTWITVGIIASTHFLQDLFKVHFNKQYNKKHSNLPYVLDQFLHLLVIFISGFWLKDLDVTPLPEWVMDIYFSPFIVVGALGFILSTVVYEITLYQYDVKDYYHTNYQPRWKNMLHRATIFLFLFFIGTQLLKESVIFLS